MDTGNQIGETAFTMPTEREIVITRVVRAPRKAVFEAFTNPDHLPKWFGKRGWTMPVCEIDLRPGGAWHFVSRGPDGTNMGMRGVSILAQSRKRFDYAQPLNGTFKLPHKWGHTKLGHKMSELLT